MKILITFLTMLLFNTLFNLDSCLASTELEEKGRDFLFIRHGQTPWGLGDILKGPQDLELNDTGRHQADMAFNIVQKHKTIKNPVIYSSNLIRAFETATIFVSHLDYSFPINKLNGLQERYYGDYSKAPPQNPYIYKPADAEPIAEFQKRVQDTIISIFDQTHKNSGDLIIFSHQKVFEFLAQWLSHQKLKLDQGGVCYFKFKNGKFTAYIYE